MCRCFSNHKHVSFQELFKFSELFVCMVPLSLVRTLGTVIVATNATHLSVTEKTTKYTAAENGKKPHAQRHKITFSLSILTAIFQVNLG